MSMIQCQRRSEIVPAGKKKKFTAENAEIAEKGT